MTDYSRNSYYGNSYDRYIDRTENSPLGKMQQQYWVTKQAVIQKLGRKEDEHVVASDSELDAKLELYRSIEQTSMTLQKVIEMYQDKILALSQEENCMGRFLKEQGKLDKTRAGKMMTAAGKSLSCTAQQRLALRVPLVRLYQEVETFRSRAIADTLINVNQMESARTEYRGALLWMKDISQELDPDTYKQLDKFRKVQMQVKRTKTKFDKLKIDCLQKIDLLAASRCNMFSHALAVYQNTLLSFWKKTSHTMASVADSFKGYQHYEFSMLKELTEPSKKLAEETSSRQQSAIDSVAQQLDEDLDKDRLIFFEEYHDDEDDKEKSKNKASSKETSKITKPKSNQEKEKDKQKEGFSADWSQSLVDLDFGESQSETKDETEELNNTDQEVEKLKGSIDLLTNQIDLEDQDKDDLTLLNEILSMPVGNSGSEELTSSWQPSFKFSEQNESFSVDWQSAFGNSNSSDVCDSSQDFLPSQLLDMNLNSSSYHPSSIESTPVLSTSSAPSVPISNLSSVSAPSQSSTRQVKTSSQLPMSAPSKQSKDKLKERSVWYNLFADLDPLSNPDAIGKKADDVSEQDRNC